MLTKNLHASKNIRLFKNPVLEALTYVHPVTPFLLFAPVIVYFLGFSTDALVFQRVLALAVGLFIWALTEYVMHRWVFHFKPTTALGKRLIYLFHGIHHDDPEDARRLVMPPSASIILAALFYFLYHGAFLVLAGEELTALYFGPLFAGFLLGYLCYDYIHFWIHFATPRTPVGKFLKQYHMLHHFVTPDQRYGVSSPLIDYLFGTDATKPSPARRPSAHR